MLFCSNNYDFYSLDKCTPLIDGFNSYSSIKSVEDSCRSLFSWEVIRNYNHDKKDKRSPIHIYSIKISNYVSLKQSGELELSFFNDRLMQTIFYPTDYQQYLMRLKSNGIDLLTKKDRSISKNVNVRSAIDYKNKFYILWIDKRLEKQYDLYESIYE
jgi:hypothetical protein